MQEEEHTDGLSLGPPLTSSEWWVSRDVWGSGCMGLENRVWELPVLSQRAMEWTEGKAQANDAPWDL